jgi:arsenite methyltransferase
MNQVKHFHYDEKVSRKQFDFAMTPDSVDQRLRVLAALNLQSDDHVLDIGSGNGFLVRQIADILGSSGRAIGVDLSDAMTLMARGLCDGLANTEFETANATKLPFDDNAFDVVTATQCLSYVDEIEVALAEIHRVVKPGGRVVLLDTDWDTLVWNCTNQSLMNKIMRSYKSIYVDAHLPRSFTNKLSDAGFKIMDRSSHTIVNWTHNLNTYAGLQINFVKAIAQNDCSVSEEDLHEWLQDLQEIERAGECFFSLNRYIFCAEKPIS